jgi:signal transduction histidine kinase
VSDAVPASRRSRSSASLRLTAGALLAGAIAVAALVAAALSGALWLGGQAAERRTLDALVDRHVAIVRDGGLGALAAALDARGANPQASDFRYEVAIWRGRPGDWRIVRETRPGLGSALLEAAAAVGDGSDPGSAAPHRILRLRLGDGPAALAGTGSARRYRVAAPDLAALSRDWDLPTADVALRVALLRPVPEVVAARRTMMAVWLGFAMALGLGLILHSDRRRRYDASLARIAADLGRFSAGDTAVRVGEADLSPELLPLAARVDQVLGRLEALISGLRHTASHTAHELRHPLARVLADVAALERNAGPEGDEAARRAALAGIRETVDRARHQFDSVMRLYQVQAETDRPVETVTDLSELVSVACDDHGDIIEDRGLTLVVQVVPGVRALADRSLMQLVLDNLLGNARKYAPDGATVTVSLAAIAGQFRLSVANTGRGFPPDLRAGAFARYARGKPAEGSSGPVRQGTGLGLALVAAIADRHGFTVAIPPSDRFAEVVMTGRALAGAEDAEEGRNA